MSRNSYVNLIIAEYSFSIKILEDWTDDLQDKDSDAFQELSFQFETEVKYCDNTLD